MICRCCVSSCSALTTEARLNFSADLMEASKNGLERIVNAAENLKFRMKNAKAESYHRGRAGSLRKDSRNLSAKFESAMDDDFNTADAVAAVFDLVKYINTNTYRGKLRGISEEAPGTILRSCATCWG